MIRAACVLVRPPNRVGARCSRSHRLRTARSDRPNWRAISGTASPRIETARHAGRGNPAGGLGGNWLAQGVDIRRPMAYNEYNEVRE